MSEHDGLRLLAVLIAQELRRGGSGSPAPASPPAPRKPRRRRRDTEIRCVSRLPRTRTPRKTA